MIITYQLFCMYDQKRVWILVSIQELFLINYMSFIKYLIKA